MLADLSNLNTGLGISVLLGVVLAVLLAMIAKDRRPLAEYGLAVAPNWIRQSLIGFAIGFAAYTVYCGVALLMGVFRFSLLDLTGYRVLSAGLSACCSVPVAVTQQIIFSGYLFSKLRPQLGRMPAVFVSGLTFAVLASILKHSTEAMTLESGRLVIGLFLIASLLGLLRVQFGNIVFPAGLLAGAIAVRRLIRKMHLLEFDGPSDWSAWFAPVNDPRQGIWFWCMVGAACMACWLVLRARGEPEVPQDQPLLTTSFKRVFPFSNLMALAPLDVWLSCLVDARFQVGAKYIPRLLWILFVSGVNTLVTLPERCILPLVLRRKVPDPVFIVGVHRSGTTHLHNLLALDSRFCTPRNFHTMNPFGAFFSGWLIMPILGIFMTMKRPMDAVTISMLSPQEEEFALAGMCRLSPYWGFSFPRSISEYNRFIFPRKLSARERAIWTRCFVHFLRKITFWSRRRPLLKSPYNTGRVAFLREIFPRAKFIHIYRHPYNVFQSNQHLVREGLVTFQLQDPDPNKSAERQFLDIYRELMQTFYGDVEQLSPGDVAEIKFEDLERDPIQELRRVYRELGMDFSDPLHRRLQRYLKNVAGYKKNRFALLSIHERQLIDARLGEFMRNWGYTDDTHVDDVSHAA